MKIDKSYCIWSPEQWEDLKKLPRSERLHMINLIQLREFAVYPAEHPKHEKGFSGVEAYRDYGRESAPIFARVGGRQVWLGAPSLVAIGPSDEHWDIAFIAEYPDFDAFITMMRDPEYQLAAQNRTAAVLNSRLIRCNPLIAGTGFGIAAA